MAMDALITNSLMVMINNEEANDIERLENPTIPSLESSSLLQKPYMSRSILNKEKRRKGGNEAAARQNHSMPHSRANTLPKISLALTRLMRLILSLAKCAESLARPQGKWAAGAPNSFSKKRMAGIEPPSRM